MEAVQLTMASMAQRIGDSLAETQDPNPFVTDLPMMDLRKVVAANAAYLVLIFALRKAMAGRDRFELKTFMRFYNLSCVILAGAVVFGLWRHTPLIWFGAGSERHPVEYKSERYWYIWLYCIQKFWEFLDTIIFALRKSDRQITFLHLFHHTSITFVSRFFLLYDVSFDSMVPTQANSIVHVFMYSHYFCSTFKINTPWRKHLTMMQLVQFLIIMAQSFTAWSAGPDRGFPDFLKIVMIAYMVSMLYLFGSFYLNRYKKPAPMPDAAATKKAA